MKKAEIRVGGHYKMLVNGKVQTVRVDRIDHPPGYGGVPPRPQYWVTNLATGRKTYCRSASKFRGPAEAK